MKRETADIFFRLFACLLLCMITTTLQAEGGDVLDRKIKLTKNKETIYHFLKQISDQSGYLFIYDSQIVDNDKEVRVPKKEYTIREAIYAITGYPNLEISVVGNHILLRLPEEKVVTAQAKVSEEPVQPKFFSLGGIIFDRLTSEPIAYGTIGVKNSTIGTVSNQNGEFILTLPDSLRHAIIKLSHIGYQNEEIEVSLLTNEENIQFSLEPKIIPLQEIVVRVVDPAQALQSMLDSRKNNYSSDPVYITAFYREGVDHKKKNIDLTEAVLKVYKTGYDSKMNSDQVKLIKMRRIKSLQESDTIYTKMKSGINSCLILDIIKNLPDFLDPKENEEPYIYTHTDINVIDNRRVNVISFVQKEYVKDPLFKGQLFIDSENNALVEAHFEINPDYTEKATNMFIERKSKDLNLKLQKVAYSVSYKLSDDGLYYINHIRGELEFKVRKKRRLFSSTLNMWFEMVNCKVETENVNGFPRNERISPRNIFSDTKFKYDRNFWGNFNVILPENKLKELIINNLNQIYEGQAEQE